MNRIEVLLLSILSITSMSAQTKLYPLDSIVYSQIDWGTNKVAQEKLAVVGYNVLSDLEDKSYLNDSLLDRNVISVIQSGDSIFAIGKFPQIFNKEFLRDKNGISFYKKFSHSKISEDEHDAHVMVTNNYGDTISYWGLMPDMIELSLVKLNLRTDKLYKLTDRIQFGDRIGDELKTWVCDNKDYIRPMTTTDELLDFLNLKGLKVKHDTETHIFIVHPREELDYPEIDPEYQRGDFALYRKTIEFVIRNDHLIGILLPPTFSYDYNNYSI